MATFEEVQSFFCEACRLNPQQLTPRTRLLHDLGIDGDDAVEILTDFGKHFAVDFSSFPFQRYFGSELGAGIRWLVRKVNGGDAMRFARSRCKICLMQPIAADGLRTMYQRSNAG